MNIFSNHKLLFTAATLLFIGLSIAVAIMPALSNQRNNAPLPGAEPLTDMALRGKAHYIANGCVACHTQQVRNVAMDEVWGARPGIAADYAGNTRPHWWMNTATLMGTERTGPDLTTIGSRLPASEWHLIHLYNPRAVVTESIMPSYAWLFTIKEHAGEGDVVVNVPAEFVAGTGVVVAKREALELVAYLQSLKQVALPTGASPQQFLYKREAAAATSAGPGSADNKPVLDGGGIYAANCQACHQASGEGLAGAFPPLKGSPIVLDKNPETLIDIIMNGYDARAAYGVMPAVGTMNELTAAEIAALVNHERTSWGNQAESITVADVEKILASFATRK